MNFKPRKALVVSISAAMLMAGAVTAEAGVKTYSLLTVADFQFNNVDENRAVTGGFLLDAPPAGTADLTFLSFAETSNAVATRNGTTIDDDDQVTGQDIIDAAYVFPGVDTFALNPGGATPTDNDFSMGNFDTDNHVVSDTEVEGGPSVQLVDGTGTQQGSVSNTSNLKSEGISQSTGQGNADSSISNNSSFFQTFVVVVAEDFDVNFSVSDIIVDQFVQFHENSLGIATATANLEVIVSLGNTQVFDWDLADIGGAFTGYSDSIASFGLGPFPPLPANTRTLSSGVYSSPTLTLLAGQAYSITINADSNVDYDATKLPEPAMVSLLGAGLLAMGATTAARRRRRQRS